MTLDEIARSKDIAISCTYCRVFRNFLLNRIARDHGVTKLAFGNTLDEEAEAVLNKLLSGILIGWFVQRELPEEKFP